jgi:(p)ppGpp synthase/HD superfamily hydrolase
MDNHQNNNTSNGFDTKKLEASLFARINTINKTLSLGNAINLKIIRKALTWCKKWHSGQFRKSGEPFYTHPLQVSIYCLYKIPKTRIITSALLHDVVEDSECSIEMVRDEFGARVAEIVYRLTNIRDGKKISTSEVTNQILELKDKEAMYIKVMDRIHNLQTLSGMPLHKKQKIAKNTIKDITLAFIHMEDLGLEKILNILSCNAFFSDNQKKSKLLLEEIYHDHLSSNCDNSDSEFPDF